MIEALLQAERLLIHGMVDQAERIYAGAFEQDPLNAIAVVGLARVALERGDDQTAYARARQALEIDPQNAAAIRLEARLAEVFAARGVTATAQPQPANAAQRPQPSQPSQPAEPAQPSQPDQPDQPDQPPEVRPSEQSILARNPSMAEHQQMEQARRYPPAPSTPVEPVERRPGLLRRLFGE